MSAESKLIAELADVVAVVGDRGGIFEQEALRIATAARALDAPGSTGIPRIPRDGSERHNEPRPQLLAVYDDVRLERARQDSKWGGADHDDEHEPHEWEAYIVEHAHKAMLAGTVSEERRRFIEVAALAVAAVESIDRQCCEPAPSAEPAPATAGERSVWLAEHWQTRDVIGVFFDEATAKREYSSGKQLGEFVPASRLADAERRAEKAEAYIKEDAKLRSIAFDQRDAAIADLARVTATLEACQRNGVGLADMVDSNREEADRLRADLAACQQACADLVRQKTAAVTERDECRKLVREYYVAERAEADESSGLAEFDAWRVAHEKLLDYASKQKASTR